MVDRRGQVAAPVLGLDPSVHAGDQLPHDEPRQDIAEGVVGDPLLDPHPLSVLLGDLLCPLLDGSQ